MGEKHRQLIALRVRAARLLCAAAAHGRFVLPVSFIKSAEVKGFLRVSGSTSDDLAAFSRNENLFTRNAVIFIYTEKKTSLVLPAQLERRHNSKKQHKSSSVCYC